jgi:hypothetical protein
MQLWFNSSLMRMVRSVVSGTIVLTTAAYAELKIIAD